ncbi:branched-subunit amino acid transport protein [Oxalobacteraceae bacterium GrIS 2.11]
MSDTDIWLVTALLTLGTFLTRATFWLVGHHITIPKRVNEALRYAPACALAAVIVPDLLFHEGQISVSLSNPQLVGGVIAAIFFLMKRSMFGALILGMAVFTAVRLLS